MFLCIFIYIINIYKVSTFWLKLLILQVLFFRSEENTVKCVQLFFSLKSHLLIYIFIQFIFVLHLQNTLMNVVRLC